MSPQARPTAALDWVGIGKQILDALEGFRARAAERRALGGLARRDLEDCGLTPADVRPDLPDLYAHDFRVARRAPRRAA